MSIGHPLPQDLCPDNEYEAWYHAINSLVNFVTSMSHLAGCYSSHLQKYQNLIELSKNGIEGSKENIHENGTTPDQPPKLLSKLYDIMEEMPILDPTIGVPHVEADEIPRTLSLVDTPQCDTQGEAINAKSDNSEGATKIVTLVKSKEYCETRSTVNCTVPDTQQKRTNEKLNISKETAKIVTLVESKTYYETSSTLNCTSPSGISATSEDTLKSQKEMSSNECVNAIRKQFPRSESIETYFTEFSDSNQTIDSLNLQEKYEALENDQVTVNKSSMSDNNQTNSKHKRQGSNESCLKGFVMEGNKKSNSETCPKSVVLKDKVRDTALLEKFSQELETFCFDLDKESSNDEIYRKGEELIDQNLEQLKKLHQEILKFNESKNAIERKSNIMESSQVTTGDPEHVEKPLTVPYFAVKTTPKKTTEKKGTDNTKKPISAAAPTNTKQNQPFSKYQNANNQIKSNRVKEQQVKGPILSPNEINDKSKDVKISKVSKDVVPKVKVATKTPLKNAPWNSPLNHLNKTSKSATASIKGRDANKMKLTGENKKSLSISTPKNVCQKSGLVCFKKEPLEKIEEMPSRDGTPVAKKPLSSKCGTPERKICPSQNNKKRNVSPKSCPDLDNVTLHVGNIEKVPKENNPSKRKTITGIPVRTRNVQPRSVSVDRVVNSNLDKKIVGTTFSGNEKNYSSLNKVPLLTTATMKLAKELNKTGNLRIDAGSEKVAEKRASLTGKIPLKTDVTMKMIEKKILQKENHQKDETVKSKNIPVDKDLLKIAAAENLEKAEQMLEENLLKHESNKAKVDNVLLKVVAAENLRKAEKLLTQGDKLV